MTDSICCSPETYRENLDFWQRAWNMVKTPYTQMPDLDYIAKIPAAIAAKMDSPVLDLGCGSGWLSIFLARNGFKLFGVDVAEHAVELAKTWAAQESLPIEFQVQDISELDYPAGYFGAVVANSIFEHLTYNRAEKAAKNLHSLLASEGLLVACFDLVGTGPGEYYKLQDGSQVYTDKGRKGMILRCFSDDEIKAILKDFEILEFSTVAQGSRFVVAAKRG